VGCQEDCNEETENRADVLGNGRLERWGERQLRSMEALAGRIVEQNRISLGFPDGRYLERARPVEAEKDSARSAAAHQEALGDAESAQFKLIVLAQDSTDIFSQVFQVLQPLRILRHCNWGLHQVAREDETAGRVRLDKRGRLLTE